MRLPAISGSGMRDARLHFPLGLTVPNSGDAVATMVTPDDPSDDDGLGIENRLPSHQHDA